MKFEPFVVFKRFDTYVVFCGPDVRITIADGKEILSQRIVNQHYVDETLSNLIQKAIDFVNALTLEQIRELDKEWIVEQIKLSQDNIVQYEHRISIEENNISVYQKKLEKLG